MQDVQSQGPPCPIEYHVLRSEVIKHSYLGFLFSLCFFLSFSLLPYFFVDFYSLKCDRGKLQVWERLERKVWYTPCLYLLKRTAEAVSDCAHSGAT